jgi:glycosyltransferase involved in cell wall biosynthesis
VVRRFLERHSVSVILGEYLHVTHGWLPLARELGIPVVAHAHGYDVSRLLKDGSWRAKYLDYNHTAAVVTMSHYSRQRLVDVGLREDRICVVPYGIDVPAQPFARSAGERIRCLAVGRLVPKKAPLLTLQAFGEAVREEPRLTLDLVGDGPLMPAVREATGRLGLRDNVRLHGALPNERTQQLFGLSDIFLQHSIVDPDSGDEEGLPVAILEAMAWALPVVSTFHAGIPEAVCHGRSGLLVPEGDVEAMAGAIVELACSPRARGAMGRKGWEMAKTRFSWEREREALYEVLARARGAA